jgi:hypothetical protein
MHKRLLSTFLLFGCLLVMAGTAHAQSAVEEYITEYPNQEQVKMMNAWLKKHEKGKFQFTGLVDPSDTTVITPQATVDYGYNWFSVSDGPAIIKVPKYDKFFSISIFDMKHNIPAVILNPDKPVLIKRPGQSVPEGDFDVVELETDQGLAFTRMVVVDNMDEVRKLSKSIVMEGGKGKMDRKVKKFSAEIEKKAFAAIDEAAKTANPDDVFGSVSGDVSPLNLAIGVRLGQLGTPSGTVRYGMILADGDNKPFNAKDTYIFTVPANIAKKSGYFSVTVYGTDNKLLIPNDKKIYDRTTYSSEQNKDGTYTITLSPDGEGLNGIPTGKPFYAVLRSYDPTPDAVMKVKITKKSD